MSAASTRPAAIQSERRLAANLGSGYALVALQAVLVLLLVPLHAAVLGPRQWGVVALCLTVHGLLSALDLLLAPLLLREAAQAAPDAAPAVYRRFLRLYGGLALGLCGLGQLLVGLLPAATAAELGWPLRIVLVQFLFQFANAAAIGWWQGRQRQAAANLRLGAFALARHGLALALVLHGPASASLWLAAFAVLAALEFGLNAWLLRSGARPAAPTGTAAALLPAGMAAYLLAMALAALGGQLDRAWLALQLPAPQYGLYYLVGSLLLALLQLQAPLGRAFLPRIAVAAEPRCEAARMLRIALLLAVPAALVALGGQSEVLLRLWLRDPALAAAGAPLLRLLLLAYALLALQAPAATLLLAARRHRALAWANGLALLAQALVLALLLPRLGLLAGGVAWLAGALVLLLATASAWRHPAGAGR